MTHSRSPAVLCQALIGASSPAYIPILPFAGFVCAVGRTTWEAPACREGARAAARDRDERPADAGASASAAPQAAIAWLVPRRGRRRSDHPDGAAGLAGSGRRTAAGRAARLRDQHEHALYAQRPLSLEEAASAGTPAPDAHAGSCGYLHRHRRDLHALLPARLAGLATDRAARSHLALRA